MERKKPAGGRKKAAKKKLVVRIEVPPLTKEQRASLKEVFAGLKVSVLGAPRSGGIVKQALVARRRGR